MIAAGIPAASRPLRAAGTSIVQIMFLAGVTAVALGVFALPAAGGGRRLRRAGATIVLAGLATAGGCAVALRIMLHWTPAGSGVAARQIPLLIEAAAAAVIGVVSPSPFGEPEHATGRWLPLLRLGTATALTAVAFGVLAAAHLDYGYLALLRDLAG